MLVVHFSVQWTKQRFFFVFCFFEGQRTERQYWLKGFEVNSKRQVCFGGQRGLVGAVKCQNRKMLHVDGISEKNCC